MNNETLLINIAKQIFEQANVEIVETVFASDYLVHDGKKVYVGSQFVIKFIRQLRSALPDLKITEIKILCQSEKTVTWQRSFCGTHKLAFRGIPASMKKVNWHEIVVTRFEENVIAEEWLVSNLAFQLLLKQKRSN